MARNLPGIWSWFRRINSSTERCTTFRPQVDPLEDRCLLSGGLTTFALSRADSGSPFEFVTAGDGNVWFNEILTAEVGRITPSGQITEYPIPSSLGWDLTLNSDGQPAPKLDWLARGPDGGLWFRTVGGGEHPETFGKLSLAGQFTQITPSPIQDKISDQAIAPIGFLPFVAQGGAILGVNADGSLSEFRLLSSTNVVLGPDGDLWYGDGPAIARLTPKGDLTDFQLGRSGPWAANVTQVAAGRDGNIWFVSSGQLGRITMQGQITAFALPFGDSAAGLRTLSDGNVWFSVSYGGYGRFGLVTPDGAITEYRLPDGARAVADLTIGSDGNLWFGAGDDNRGTHLIGRLSISALPSAAIATVPASQGTPYTAPLAVLTLPNPQGVHVSVDSGNGTSTPATLALNPDGTYAVMAPVEYHVSGTYTATVNVTNSAGITTAFVTTVTVAPGPNQLYVTQMYQDMLSRVPDSSGLLFWTTALDHGNTREQAAAGLRDSTEFRTTQVTQLYSKLLGRQADADGMSFFLNYLKQGGAMQGVENAMLASPEFTANAGNANTPFVQALYQHVLGRTAEQGGLDYWSSLLDQGVPVGAVADEVVSSAEGKQHLIESDYQQWLQRPADGSGLSYFMRNLAGERMSDDLLTALLASDEYFKRT